MGNSFFGSRLKFGDLMSDLSYSFTQREVGRGARKSDQVWLPFGSCDLYRHDRPWLLAGKACLPLTSLRPFNAMLLHSYVQAVVNQIPLNSSFNDDFTLIQSSQTSTLH